MRFIIIFACMWFATIGVRSQTISYTYDNLGNRNARVV